MIRFSSALKVLQFMMSEFTDRTGGRRISLLLTTLILVNSSVVLGDPIPPGQLRALGDIFADGHIIDAALSVHDRAMAMSPQDRFEFLNQWVLPNDAHSSLRLDIAFSPTYPAQIGDEPPTVVGRRVASGGEVVCPALDLIDTAKQLNQIPVIRSAVKTWNPADRVGQRKLFAFRCLIEIADKDVDRAVAACTRFLQLTDNSDSQNSRDRNDRLLLILKAEAMPEIQELMADYARQVLAPGRWPMYFDVWSRQFTRLAFRITPAMIEDESPETLNTPLQSTVLPKYWTPVTYPMAARRGPGMPVAEWHFARSKVINVANHGDDSVYFNIPLLGDVAVEADTTVSNWREAEMIVGTHWVGTSHLADLYATGTVRRRIGDFKSAKPTTRMQHWYRHRTSVKGSVAQVSLDGNVVHQENFPNPRDPWIGIRSRHLNEGGARNIRISGSPEIPETIDMIGPGLDAWFDYYAVEDPWEKLPWSLNQGEIAGQKLPESHQGMMVEKALFYHRPMLEDGRIEYEFYYKAGAICTHPAMDRHCFILNPREVALHHLTDGAYEQTATDPANIVKTFPRRNPLPLKQDEWNRMQLQLRGDEIELVLNDESIARQRLPATNQRFVGFFHYADQEQVRVRNMLWNGEWSRTLPSADVDELAGSQSDFLDNHRDHLKAKFQHDFSKQGMPPELFRLVSGEQAKDVTLSTKGLMMKSVTTRVSSVSLAHTVGGDFDIYARYTDFQGAAEGGGARLMTRIQNPAFHEVIGGRKHMIHAKDLQENVGFLWHGFYNAGIYSYEYDKGQNIEETAGTVRLSRRGDTIYILTAEDSSDHYRLHVRQKVGTEDLSAGGVQLQCEMPGASVIWTGLEIHAERIETARQVIAKLNRSRDEMTTSTEMDFSKSSFDALLNKNRDVKWVPESGLRMQNKSDSGNWLTPMSLAQPLRGDFDVAMEFEIETLTNLVPGESSLLAFQIELPDQERTRCQAVLFHDSTGINRLVVHQQCVSARSGKDESTETHAVILKTLTGLRIARQGRNLTIVATSPECGGEFVLAQFQQSQPTRPATLNVFAHAGGPDAEISVLLKRLSVHSQ